MTDPDPPAPAPTPPPTPEPIPVPEPAVERPSHGDRSQRWGVWVAAGAALLAVVSSVYTAVLSGDTAQESELRQQRREAYSSFMTAERKVMSAARQFFRAGDVHLDGTPENFQQLDETRLAYEQAREELRSVLSDVELTGSFEAIAFATALTDTYQNNMDIEIERRFLFERTGRLEDLLPPPPPATSQQAWVAEPPISGVVQVVAVIEAKRSNFLRGARADLESGEGPDGWP